MGYLVVPCSRSAAFVTLLTGFYRLRIRQLQTGKASAGHCGDDSGDGFFCRPDGSTEFVNRPWLEFTGSSELAILGFDRPITVHPDDLDDHLNKWRTSLATGAPFENEARHCDADGAYRWFLVRAVPLRDRHGTVLKWFGTLTDIEDRKRSEQERERLRQLQADLAHENRVSMMGELAASLSHELKQPIAAAITDTGTCLRWLTCAQPDVEEAREATMRAMKDSTRAAEIIDRLRSFYKEGAPEERELVDVNELVREMLVLLRSEANRYSIGMGLDLAIGLPKITADRVQLQQVLMNLMLNAIEAMKDTAGELTIKSELGEDGQLLISVSDTGVGSPAEKTDQIFKVLLHDKTSGLRHGPGDQPLHNRITRRSLVGERQQRTGRDVSVHPACLTRFGEIGRMSPPGGTCCFFLSTRSDGSLAEARHLPFVIPTGA